MQQKIRRCSRFGFLVGVPFARLDNMTKIIYITLMSIENEGMSVGVNPYSFSRTTDAPMKPVFIEIPNCWAWTDNLGR